MMKRIICLFIAVLMLFLLPACSTTSDDPSTGKETDDKSKAEQIELANSKSAHYSIVIPQNCSGTVTSASTKLMNALKEASGHKPERYYDDTEKYPENEKEILIGLTSRESSALAMEELQEDEYLIQQRGSKIVVLAANEYLLGQAVNALIATWSVSEKKVVLPLNLSLCQNLSENMIPLLEDGNFRFSVVYAKDLSVKTKNMLSGTVANLQKTFECGTISVKADSDVKADNDRFEILVGHTNRKQSDTAYGELTEIGYRISMNGNKITIAASGEAMLERAIQAFYDDAKHLSETTLVGDLKLQNDYRVIKGDDVIGTTWYTSVPSMTEGMITVGYSGNSGSCILERENTTVEGFRTYVAKLEQAGFTDGEDYTLDGNLYALRYGEKATVYVSYSDKAKTMRLYVEKKGLNEYPAKGTVSTTNRYEPILWQLNVDSKGSKQNGGMCYVMLTGNGTFVIIDGGYNTEAEADHLYNFLMEHKPADMAKPVIEAWYLSHLHGDHIGGMYAFSKKYSKEIDVLSFYYHFDFLGTGTSKASFMSYAQSNLWKDAVHYCLHTGMEFNLSGIQFQALYTLEDIYPITADDGIEFNNTSTVLRATVKGQRVLFLGDAMDLASNCMLKYLSANTLKSDIVQFSHHGYEGGTKALYNAIAAPTVLWPMNVVGYQETGYSTVPQNVFKIWHTKTQGAYAMPNYYICYQATYVKEIVIAGMGDAEINFPYTPTGYGTNANRLPDFNAYYEDNKNS